VGIRLTDCDDTVITGCTVRDSRDAPLMTHAIHWDGSARNSLIANCVLARSLNKTTVVPDTVTVANNLETQS